LEALKAATEINGAELIRRARAGDGTAWEEVVSTFSRRIFNLAYRFTSSIDAAEDLTQEALVAAEARLYGRNRTAETAGKPLVAGIARQLRRVLRRAEGIRLGIGARRGADRSGVFGHL